MRRCDCLTEQKVKATIPPKYHNARLADFKEEFIASRLTPWLSNPTEGLLLIGEVGSGKTHLASAIVRAMLETGKQAEFRCASELYLDIRESYGNNGTSERQIMLRYCSASMLVLDDIGAGSLSDHERRILFEVLNRRGNECRPTVVTTNLSLDQIRGLIDERISSRLKDYLTVAFTGADRRGKRARA
jgi:DNA replication protein DnaC